MKIYHLFNFDRSIKVRWLAKELEVNLEVIQLDASQAEHKSEHFKKINPFSLIPTAVKDNGEVLFEASAICIDLCLQHKPSLIDLNNSQFQQWLSYFNSSLDQLSGGIIMLNIMGESSEIRTALENKIPNKLAAMEAYIANKEYWYQDTFSLLDIFAWNNLAYLFRDGQLTNYPNLCRYLLSLNQRPALAEFSPDNFLYQAA